MPIKRTEIKVRAGVVLGPVRQVCHEDGMGDEGRIGECEAGDSASVFLEATTLEKGVEDEFGVREGRSRQGELGLDAAGVCGAGPAAVWILETIASAIWGTKDVGRTKKSRRGVRHRVVEDTYALDGRFLSERELRRCGREKAEGVGELGGGMGEKILERWDGNAQQACGRRWLWDARLDPRNRRLCQPGSVYPRALRSSLQSL